MERIPTQESKIAFEMDEGARAKVIETMAGFTNLLKKDMVPAIVGMNALCNILVNVMNNCSVSKDSYMDFCENVWNGIMEDIEEKDCELD